MKEITKTSRLAGQLEKLFRMLNDDFFDGALTMPVITIQSTPRAYGHVSAYNAWSVKGDGAKELNIGAGTLYRPIENTIATMLHEMCHLYNMDVLKVQDCSRGGTYHNTNFKSAAESHGLICNRSDRYGWSDTSTDLSDELIEWVLSNDIPEIRLYRDELTGVRVAGGNTTGNGNTTQTPTRAKNHSIKYMCPCCGNSARATKHINIICGDCMTAMLEC